MRGIAVSACVVLALALSCDGQQERSLSRVFHNDRLKRAELNDYEITGDSDWRKVDGMWVPESNHPANDLLFLEQVTITCTQATRTCEELKVILEPIGGLIFIDGVDRKVWNVTSWDEHGLLATYDADPSDKHLSEKCHRHVLSMSFASGSVSASDIPTHEKGCETFRQTDSYRLVRGNYYVDTTPGNDADKPAKPELAGAASRNMPKGAKREQFLPITLGGFLKDGPKEEQVRGVCEPDETRNLLNCDMYNGLRGWTISELTIAVVWAAQKNENIRYYAIPVTIAPLTSQHLTLRLGLQLPPDEIFRFPDGKASTSKRWHWQNVAAKGYPAE